jgi:hypothetical protein
LDPDRSTVEVATTSAGSRQRAIGLRRAYYHAVVGCGSGKRRDEALALGRTGVAALQHAEHARAADIFEAALKCCGLEDVPSVDAGRWRACQRVAVQARWARGSAAVAVLQPGLLPRHARTHTSAHEDTRTHTLDRTADRSPSLWGCWLGRADCGGG